MTIETAQILTVESIPTYIGNRLEALKGVVESVESIIKVDAIQGGNVNYAFCITLQDTTGSSSTKKIFLKQAPEFVAIFGPDGFPLTSERMQREMDVYSEWNQLLTNAGYTTTSQMLPQIYYFDSTYMCLCVFL